MLIEYIGTVFFALALLHTFSVSFIAKLAHRYPKGSARESFFHLLSEVEVVFGFWAFLFLTVWAFMEGVAPVVSYQQSLNMTEPLFIFCIMILASTRPVVLLAKEMILFLSSTFSKILPVHPLRVQFFVLLTIGPLLGSLITEPAAITIVALLLYRMLDNEKVDAGFLHGLLALLFVNISVGGALTHFAAPPILVVARGWGWGLADVFLNLGWVAIISIFVNTLFFIFITRNKMIQMLRPIQSESVDVPLWVTLIHLFFLGAVVVFAHHAQVFMGLFLIFVGFTTVTMKYQEPLKFRQALLVGFFLGGLIVFGSFQKWWLEPLIQGLNEKALYVSAIGLTAVTDNAALTYLGSQVTGLTDSSKWALVAGALVGGGLTILANAPNPAGFSILSSKFPNASLNAAKLFLNALPLTIITGIIFLVCGNF